MLCGLMVAKSYRKELLTELAHKTPVICLESENLHKRCGRRGIAEDKMSIMGKNAKLRLTNVRQNCNISHPRQNWTVGQKNLRVID